MKKLANFHVKNLVSLARSLNLIVELLYIYIYIYNLIRELNVLYLSFFQVIMFLHTLLVPTTITIRAFFIIYIVKARVCNKNESIF